MPPKIRKSTSKKTNSCLNCNEPDDDFMVCCDNCDGWYHFICVGVSSDVEYRDWRCLSCTAMLSSISDSGTLHKGQINGKVCPNTASSEGRQLDQQQVCSEESTKGASSTSAQLTIGTTAPNFASAGIFVTAAAPISAQLTSVTSSNFVTVPTAGAALNIFSSNFADTHAGQSNSNSFGSANVPFETLNAPCNFAFTADTAGATQTKPGANVFGTLATSNNLNLLTVDDKRQRSSALSSVSACSSVYSRRRRKEFQIIEKEQEILRKQSELLRKRKELLAESEDDSSSRSDIGDDDAPGKESHPAPRAESTNSKVIKNTTAQTALAPMDQMQPFVNMILEKLTILERQIQAKADNTTSPQWMPNGIANMTSGGQNAVSFNSPEDPTKMHVDIRPLTRNQIAARHIGKDLPKYDGKPDEWPSFMAAYEQTTTICGFSDCENLIRLRSALIGDAHNAVKNLLLHASCVPQIISTLRMKFGRPELIINVLISRIRELPSVKENKLETLVDFAIEVQNICATMKASGLSNHLNNPTLEQELVGKLPGLLGAFWGMHKLSLASWTIENFSNWVFQLAQGANSVIVPTASSKAHKKGLLGAHSEEVAPAGCVACSGDCTNISECTFFKCLDRSAKWSLVQEKNLCRRCLHKHSRKYCASTSTCNIDGCSRVHHPLLHNKASMPPATFTTTLDVNCNTHRRENDTILFRLIPVTLYGKGVQLSTYAFLDDGSSLTLMDAELRDDLNLKGSPRPLCLRWTANTHRYEDESTVFDMEISAVGKTKRFQLNEVHTVRNLDLPPQTLDAKLLKSQHKHLQGIPFATYANAKPRLLIGLNNSLLGLCLKSREGGVNEPVAEKTRLGWTIKGKLTKRDSSPDLIGYQAFHMCDCEIGASAELLQTVKDYICNDNLEVTSTSKTPPSVDDEIALAQLEQFTKRVSGRFETGLLWRCPNATHPDSLPVAKKRARCLLLKIKKDAVLSSTLIPKIESYVSKGYARMLLPHEIGVKNCWYLPIFPVLNVNKPGKVRLVWDAAAKTEGISLNSMLLKGPDQLTALVSVLRKFRQGLVAVSGDIEEMYHQIKVRSEDQNYQRFLWIDPNSMQCQHFAMTVMTFGATCSPSCAQYVKNLNANEYRERFPRAAQSIINNHYVDDMLDSMNTEEEVLKLARDVAYIHSKGGFHIRNWHSNSTAVLKALESDATETVNMNVENNMGNATEKVLGMWWVTSEDNFSFKLSKRCEHLNVIHGQERPTKREVLSIIMGIYDPLGLISFYVMYAKICFQDIWRSGIGWDDRIHDSEFAKWSNWVQHFPELEKIRIPRCYFTSVKSAPLMELHTFVDASENGYAAVCYLVCTENGEVDCALLGSKTRVAPLKLLSIPRLELQAAVLGARICSSLLSSHTIQITKKTFWSDSRTVLAWLRSDHRRYSQFVAFRISEILEVTDVRDWRWIPSAENVADEATKWNKTPDFSNNSRWLSGPPFLKRSPDKWPSADMVDVPTDEELRPCYIGCHSCAQIVSSPLSVEPERFSKWSRMLRAMSTVLYAVRIWKEWKKQQRITTKSEHVLTQDDLISGEILLWRKAQFDCYRDEIVTLQKGQSINKSSDLYTLSPYLDKDTVLRHEGRIIQDGRKNPVILPRKHYITNLIVANAHAKRYHGNIEAVVNDIRQFFCIPKLRSVVYKVRRDCQECKNRDARPKPPRMAPVPNVRLAAYCRPFSYAGVDYFGPISVSVRRVTEKRYGVLLTCLTTRAIHIEVAYSLSTDSCILAIRNFMARRGAPIELWSDNGTNFKGAQRELQDAFNEMDQNEMVKAFTSSSMCWRFIPPASPHMGGAWERLVRSVKDVLYRIMPSRYPSEELLRSALMEVEAVVNSRPLTYIPIANENEEALTPNHFLLGSSNGLKPLAEPTSSGIVLRNTWRMSQQLADAFWRRWVREYLPMITRRTKWFDDPKPIEIGDIVYIVDSNSPRNCWPKGRIVAIKKGADDRVRSALVKTATGLYERPAAKIAVLSVDKLVVDPSGIPGGSVAKNTATPNVHTDS